jgi:hypothetical protein
MNARMVYQGLVLIMGLPLFLFLIAHNPTPPVTYTVGGVWVVCILIVFDRADLIPRIVRALTSLLRKP